MRKEIKCIAAVLTACLIICAVMMTTACGDEPVENMLPPVASGTVVVTPVASIPTNVEPSVRGYVTRITYAAEYTEILVEYFPQDPEAPEFAYTKVLLKLDDKSAVAYGRNNDAYTRTLLSVGSEVEAWFSDTTAESYPVIAYGQAVRVVKAPGSMTEIRRLPYLSVAGGSTCLTVVTGAEWNGQQLEHANVLEDVSGAHMSAAAEDIITLKFSSMPDDVRAYWSSSSYTMPYSKGREIEITDGKISVPSDASGKIFIKVEAEWGKNSAQYAFSVTVQDPLEQG